MTGVLPIKKYSSGSALNMFDEYTFLKDRKFGEYFRFMEKEVLELCKKNRKMEFKVAICYDSKSKSHSCRIEDI